MNSFSKSPCAHWDWNLGFLKVFCTNFLSKCLQAEGLGLDLLDDDDFFT